jgi:hypothetical protein
MTKGKRIISAALSLVLAAGASFSGAGVANAAGVSTRTPKVVAHTAPAKVDKGAYLNMPLGSDPPSLDSTLATDNVSFEVLGNTIYNKKLFKTIESCYKKTPYYSNAFPVIENIINQDEGNLAKFLEFSINQICEYLSINTEIIVSSTINKNNDLKGQNKVIEICKVLGADEYYNAIGGRDIYSYDDFASYGINLSFLKTKTVEYKQSNNEFMPNLSIIDVMMFNSIGEIKKMLGKYELL